VSKVRWYHFWNPQSGGLGGFIASGVILFSLFLLSLAGIL